MTYIVDAHTANSSFTGEEINAQDLYELAKYVRETFAWMNGCHDTSEVDCSWISFEYDFVEDEDGNDITSEATDCI